MILYDSFKDEFTPEVVLSKIEGIRDFDIVICGIYKYNQFIRGSDGFIRQLKRNIEHRKNGCISLNCWMYTHDEMLHCGEIGCYFIDEEFLEKEASHVYRILIYTKY